MLTQLGVGYRDSPLSEEGYPRVGRLHAGYRMPDATVTCGGQRVRLHELMARPGVHVILQRDATEPAWANARHVRVHRVSSEPGCGLVAVPPDGYIGFQAAAVDATGLGGWLTRVGAT